MKLVINKCYGGFGISPKAALWLYEKGFDEEEFAVPVDEYYKDPRDQIGPFRKEESLKKWREYLATPDGDIRFFLTVFTPDEKSVLSLCPSERAHPLLVECVETLGKAADGSCARLKIIEIPDGVDWEIDEYDGMESVHEKHRSWG